MTIFIYANAKLMKWKKQEDEPTNFLLEKTFRPKRQEHVHNDFSCRVMAVIPPINVTYALRLYVLTTDLW